MQEQETPQPSIEKSTYSNKIVITLALSILILLGAGYFFKDFISSRFGGDTKKVIVQARDFNPTGNILLTLGSITKTDLGLYTYSIADKKLTKTFGKEGIVAMTAHDKGSDPSTTLFASNIPSTSSKKSTNILQIFSLNNGETKQLTNNQILFKRQPSFSDSLQTLIYAGIPVKTKGTALTLDDFNVYALGQDGKDRLITNGSIPTLTPDGKQVVVLRKDGLYVSDIVGSSTEKVWGLDRGISRLSLQFAISHSGKQIAWTMPNQGGIYIMNVTSWKPFVGKIAQRLPVSAFWPVFSPNDQYLAFEQFDRGSSTPINQRLTIFDLVTPQFKVVQDLTSYDQLKLFVTEWK
jgi:hypothetical protein